MTLLGPGGAGKTRLSQEGAETAAAASPEAWPHGVWLAELAPVDDPQTVPEAVLTALGARETVVRGTTAEGLRAAADPTALDPLARLAEHCAGRRMLLVLDNCEHVIDAAAGLAERLLADCPGVTVLATSREPLAVPGEVLRPVEPLPDPTALRLLADRGAAARPGFRVEDDPAACAEICRRLDGLPLAIELAAARLRMLSPRQLADRLDDRFRLLTSGSRTLLPRQQTLRAVVDWSWELTDEPERAVLRRLSVFAGGCDLAAAEEVCAGDGVDGREVAGLLGSLIDKSLVVAAPAGEDGAGGEMRYRLLETVGEYAGERLDEAGSAPVPSAATSSPIANWPVPPTRCCAGPASVPVWSGWSWSTTICVPPCAVPWPPGTSTRRCAWCCPSSGSGRCGTTAAMPGTGRPRPPRSAPTPLPRLPNPPPTCTRAPSTDRRRWLPSSCWRPAVRSGWSRSPVWTAISPHCAIRC